MCTYLVVSVLWIICGTYKNYCSFYLAYDTPIWHWREMVAYFCRNSLKRDPKLRFHSCYAAVRHVIHSYSIEPVVRQSHTAFCALSFYVDRAIDTKLIGSISIFSFCCSVYDNLHYLSLKRTTLVPRMTSDWRVLWLPTLTDALCVSAV